MQILQTSSVTEVLSPEDQLALLLAAVCHDLDHDGYSNSYHGVCAHAHACVVWDGV